MSVLPIQRRERNVIPHIVVRRNAGGEHDVQGGTETPQIGGRTVVRHGIRYRSSSRPASFGNFGRERAQEYLGGHVRYLPGGEWTGTYEETMTMTMIMIMSIMTMPFLLFWTCRGTRTARRRRRCGGEEEGRVEIGEDGFTVLEHDILGRHVPVAHLSRLKILQSLQQTSEDGSHLCLPVGTEGHRGKSLPNVGMEISTLAVRHDHVQVSIVLERLDAREDASVVVAADVLHGGCLGRAVSNGARDPLVDLLDDDQLFFVVVILVLDCSSVFLAAVARLVVIVVGSPLERDPGASSRGSAACAGQRAAELHVPVPRQAPSRVAAPLVTGEASDEAIRALDGSAAAVLVLCREEVHGLRCGLFRRRRRRRRRAHLILVQIVQVHPRQLLLLLQYTSVVLPVIVLVHSLPEQRPRPVGGPPSAVAIGPILVQILHRLSHDSLVIVPLVQKLKISSAVPLQSHLPSRVNEIMLLTLGRGQGRYRIAAIVHAQASQQSSPFEFVDRPSKI
mmetsp:Transcript_17184/g.49770  ORF Transcript_17184/g.49770 Transcript_17184/m.49770 type:complete len:506 (-) Transcript_17184:2-1519(-)